MSYLSTVMAYRWIYKFSSYNKTEKIVSITHQNIFSVFLCRKKSLLLWKPRDSPDVSGRRQDETPWCVFIFTKVTTTFTTQTLKCKPSRSIESESTKQNNYKTPANTNSVGPYK